MTYAQRVVGALPAPRWAFVPLREFYIAVGLVCTASSALAIAQAALGWYPFPVWPSSHYPGLLYNPVHQGLTLAIVIVAFVVNRFYWFIPGFLPGLWLAHSRGAWLALALGLTAIYFRRPFWFLVAAIAFGVLFSYHPSSSDLQRLQIWYAALTQLTFWGNGFGSFYNLYMGPLNHIIHPEYAHNDYLQTVFEFGIWSVIPFVIVAWAASRTSTRDWPVLITFLFMACFSMPLHMPIVAALGAIALATTLMEMRNA